MYWLKAGFGGKGMMYVEKRREWGKQKFSKDIKREKFGYLLEIARGVWVFKDCKWKRMSLQPLKSSKHTQLFKFSCDLDKEGWGDKKG